MLGRFKVLKYRLARCPVVALHVNGRKLFDTKHSMVIRTSWKVGNYGRVAGL